eukprot:TRINITY_DN27004_c0_g1_i1.p1 TRINITY_DN27004_c0_g1~~TRINITY_DN27004_c0_g1_i1.p1  ORF type:complete len:588 (-),score=122.34 TRINITY_DN27004_c0_g1_i1:118-1881(-)
MRTTFGGLGRNKADTFKDIAKRTDDGLKDAGVTVNRVFESFRKDFPSGAWFTRPDQPGFGEAPGSAPPFGGYSSCSAAPSNGVSSARGQTSRDPGCAVRPVFNDDAAMRYHCTALDRLIGMGYSVQAARSAMQHFDDWLASAAGSAALTAAETAARLEGEAILHIGDTVRLAGLVKNPTANGKVGLLQAYGTESQRWRVHVLDEEKVYWIKPKLLTPVEVRKSPMDGEAGGAASSTAPPQALAMGWAKLEAHQAVTREKQELRDLELESKEHKLQRLQAELEAQAQQLVVERRRSQKMEQALKLAAKELQGSGSAAKFIIHEATLEAMQESVSDAAASASDLGAGGTGMQGDSGSSASPAGADVVPAAVGNRPSERRLTQDAAAATLDSKAIERQATEMYDLDWTALEQRERARSQGSPSAAIGTNAEMVAEPEDWEGREGADSASSGLPAEKPTAWPVRPLQTREGGETTEESDESKVPESSPREPGDGRPQSCSKSGALKDWDPPPNLEEEDREAFMQVLAEKRRLAELHSGEDHTVKLNRPSVMANDLQMHPTIANKLLERRRRIEEAEEAAALAAGHQESGVR